MNDYQQQVLETSDFYQHWLSKNKTNLNLHDFKNLNTKIKNENLISTITQLQDSNLLHTKPLNVFFIILRVETSDYILLTCDKQSDIATGYPDFLHLPIGDIDLIHDYPKNIINLSCSQQDLQPLKPNPHFFNSNYQYITKTNNKQWSWLQVNSTKKYDYDTNQIGWWSNTYSTSHYYLFWQVIKNISFTQFSKIVQEIENQNKTNQSKIVIVPRNHLDLYSLDITTIAALYLTKQSNKSCCFHLDYQDVYRSIIIAFIFTLLLLFFIS